MEAGTGTAAGRDSVFVETTFEDAIDGLLGMHPSSSLSAMGELAKEILAAGREQMEANNALRRELEAATVGDGQIRRTFVVGDVQDPELQAAGILVELLEPFDATTRTRLLGWAVARYGLE